MGQLNVEHRPCRPEISRTLHLLTLPAEIRIRLYSFLLAANAPLLVKVDPMSLCLRQPDKDGSGIDDYQGRTPLSTQFLRTCQQIYNEAAVFLYSTNTFLILEQDTSSFEHLVLNPSIRLCINKLQIRIPRFGEQPDYNAVSKTFPSVTNLSVFAPGPGPSLLFAAFSLSQILVNSQVCDSEPLLELHVRIPNTARAIISSAKTLKDPSYYSVQSNTNTQFYNIFRSPLTFKMTSLNVFSKPLLRLGQEISGFAVISIHGVLHPDYLHAIEQHECNYGDCSFEKVKETDVRKDGVKEMTFVWKQKGGKAAAIRDTVQTDIANLMRIFVPKLSLRFIEALKEAGMDTKLLEKR